MTKLAVIAAVILLSGCSAIASRHVVKACSTKNSMWNMTDQWCERHGVVVAKTK